MSARLSEQEVAREARRILRRLAGRRVALHALADDRFAVARDARGAAQSRVAVGGDHVRAFLAQGWVASDGPGRFVIAEAGAAFLTRASGDDGFAAQHRLMTGAGPAAVNAGESPLARLAFRQLIDPVQLAAGEKLRRDFTLAQMMPRLGVDFSAPAVSGMRGAGAGHVSDTALAAKQRFSRALTAVGPELADLLFDVCCHLSSLEQAETRRSWSKRSGRVVLTIALDRLADHYGLRVTAPARRAIRSWAMENQDRV